MSIEYVELTIEDAAPIEITISDIPEAGPDGGAGVTDGDKGDIVVSGSGATWTIDSALFRTGNTLFVDAEIGNDSTGAADGSKPYLTLAAAKAAASSGDTIVVRPGSYTVSATILKNGVNWYFQPGAVVTATSTASVIGDSASAVVSDIDGFATFSASGGHTVHIQHPSSVVNIRCKKIENTGESRGGVVASAGVVNVVCDLVTCVDYDNVLTLDDATNSPSIFIQANRLTPGSGGDAIECNKGKIVAIVNRADASGDIGIWASAGSIVAVVNDIDPLCSIFADGGTVKVLNYDQLSDVAFTGAFTDLASRPTTLSGYGITDAASSIHTHDASAINTGTLDDARLSANIPRMVGGVIQPGNLPSYVDDVLEFANLAAFPVTGETGKIYVALNTNLTYRWSGSAYVEISPSSAVWGNISGTLSSQTDLQNALNAKQNTITLDPNSIAGNNTGSSASPVSLSATQVRALLGLATTDSPTFAGVTLGTSGILVGGTNRIEQRNGTNAQILEIAKTWTSATVFEELTLDASSDASNYRIGSRIGSAGGTTRGLQLGSYNAAGAWTSWLGIGTDGNSQIRRLGIGLGTPDLSALHLHIIDASADIIGFYVQNTSDVSSTGSPRIAIGHGGPTAFSVTAWQNRSFVEGQGSNGLVLGGSGVSGAPVRIYSNRTNWNTGITLTTGNRVLIGTATDDGSNRLQVSGAVVTTGDLTIVPSSSRTLSTNGQFSIEMTSNTAGNLVYRGSDGTTRRMALTFS